MRYISTKIIHSVTGTYPVPEIVGLLDLAPELANSHHPDVLLFTGQERSIGIETIQRISTWVGKKPYQGDVKLVVVQHADRMTIPAQNAFLKTLEEPSSDTEIVLITSNPQRLLDTVRSRCEVVVVQSAHPPTRELPVEKFVKGSFLERLNLIEDLVKEEEAIHTTREFLGELVKILPANQRPIAKQWYKALADNVSPKLVLQVVAAEYPS